MFIIPFYHEDGDSCELRSVDEPCPSTLVRYRHQSRVHSMLRVHKLNCHSTLQRICHGWATNWDPINKSRQLSLVKYLKNKTLEMKGWRYEKLHYHFRSSCYMLIRLTTKTFTTIVDHPPQNAFLECKRGGMRKTLKWPFREINWWCPRLLLLGLCIINNTGQKIMTSPFITYDTVLVSFWPRFAIR